MRGGGTRRAGGERDHGREADDRLSRAVRLGREHARPLRARRLRCRCGDRVRRPEARRVPGGAGRARGGRDAWRHDVRDAGGVSWRGSRRNVEGDARDQGRRHGRSRAPAGRRPAERREAALRPRRRLSPLDRRRDPRGLRRLGRLARAGRVRGGGAGRRDVARGAVRCGRKPRWLAPEGGRRLAATTSRGSRTSGSLARATAAPSAAGRSRSRPRSRSGTSSTSARNTRCR